MIYVLYLRSKEDCVLKGWVLSGFPITQNQASALRQASMAPSRVVALQCDLDTAKSRCADQDSGVVADRYKVVGEHMKGVLTEFSWNSKEIGVGTIYF